MSRTDVVENTRTLVRAEMLQHEDQIRRFLEQVWPNAAQKAIAASGEDMSVDDLDISVSFSVKPAERWPWPVTTRVTVKDTGTTDA